MERHRAWAHFKYKAAQTTSPMYEENSDNEAGSSRYQIGVQRGQTRRKIEELPDIIILDELVRRRIQEAKLHPCSEPTLSAIRVSDSPHCKEILKCEFSKKFSAPSFDYYSRVSTQFNISVTFRIR